MTAIPLETTMNALRRIVPALSILCFATAASAADIQTRTIKFPSASNRGHPQVLGVEKFAELVKQKSDGKLTVRPFPGGTLGPDLQVVSALQGGTVEMNVMNASLLAGNVKEMTLFDVPYLFNNAKEADAIADGPIGKKLLDKLQEKGLVGLAYWDLGFRQIHTAKKPISKADDFKGVKMRVIPTPIYVDFMNALGANAVPMPFTELYTALETKAVDGQEGPYTTILTNKIYEVQKYLSATRHIYGVVVVLVGKKFWDQLSGDEQKILQDSCKEARDYERSISREMSPKSLAELQAKGMEFNEIAPEEMARMRAAVKPVLDEHSKEVGEELIAQAYAAIEKAKQP